MNEVELAKKVESRDHEAAEEFVREHYPAVLRLTLRLTGKREEAEDLAQETFLVARQKIGTYKGRSTLRTWIHKIALNQYRQWRRKRAPISLSDQEFTSPDSSIAAFETGHVLMNAMSRLSHKHREAFVLFEIEELSMEEVAHVLGVPVGTAKARVFYARQSLRRQLQGTTVEVNDELIHSSSNG